MNRWLLTMLLKMNNMQILSTLVLSTFTHYCKIALLTGLILVTFWCNKDINLKLILERFLYNFFMVYYYLDVKKKIPSDRFLKETVLTIKKPSTARQRNLDIRQRNHKWIFKKSFLCARELSVDAFLMFRKQLHLK